MTAVRRLGRSGLAVSAVGLGCNNLGKRGTATEDLAGSRAVVDAALEAGITLFDVADIYGSPAGASEEMLGVALGTRRADVVVATKFGMDARGANGADSGARGSRRYIRIAVENALRRLRTDWIDLFQLHQLDPLTPLEETVAALDELVAAGKVRYTGHSNLTGWQLADADWIARSAGRTPFVSAQNEYSLVKRAVEAELLPAAEAFGVGFLPYYALASGLLTGKYTQGVAPEGTRLSRPGALASAPWEALGTLQAFADERGVRMLDVAIGWLLSRPQVSSVIAGATRPEQVRANVAAGESWTPDADELAAIDEIFPGPA